MEPSAVHKVQPKEFFRKFLEAGVRPSGRSLNGVRKTVVAKVPLTNAETAVVARVGNTSVMCGLKLEVGVPCATRPREGKLEVEVTLKPLCSSSFVNGADNDRGVGLAQYLTMIMNHCFDPTQLCIQEGRSCWVVYAEIVCLDFDGNLVDSSALALVSALRSLMLPFTVVDEDEPTAPVKINRALPAVPMVLRRLPLHLSFVSIDGFILADPCLAEEELSDASWAVVFNESGELMSVQKPGGRPLGESELRVCLELSRSRAQEQLALLQLL